MTNFFKTKRDFVKGFLRVFQRLIDFLVVSRLFLGFSMPQSSATRHVDTSNCPIDRSSAAGMPVVP